MSGSIIIGIHSYKLNLMEKKLLSEKSICGVILFKRNFESKLQIKELINSVQELRYKHQLPSCIVSIDHEGGVVQRLTGKNFTNLPAAQAIGNLYKENKADAVECIKTVAQITAFELTGTGFNMCLGPVLDIRNPSLPSRGRCFGNSADMIAELSYHYIKECRSLGLLCAPKHFPGITGSDNDPHISISNSKSSLEEVLKSDLMPYSLLRHRGELDALITAHIKFGKIDNHMVCNSKVWLKDIARNTLRFDGLIMSDCIHMASAISLGSSLKKQIMTSLHSGCDIIMSSQTPFGHYSALYNTIKSKDYQEYLEIEGGRKSIARVSRFFAGNLDNRIPHKDKIKIYKTALSKHQQLKSSYKQTLSIRSKENVITKSHSSESHRRIMTLAYWLRNFWRVLKPNFIKIFSKTTTIN